MNNRRTSLRERKMDDILLTCLMWVVFLNYIILKIILKDSNFDVKSVESSQDNLYTRQIILLTERNLLIHIKKKS